MFAQLGSQSCWAYVVLSDRLLSVGTSAALRLLWPGSLLRPSPTDTHETPVFPIGRRKSVGTYRPRRSYRRSQCFLTVSALIEKSEPKIGSRLVVAIRLQSACVPQCCCTDRVHPAKWRRVRPFSIIVQQGRLPLRRTQVEESEPKQTSQRVRSGTASRNKLEGHSEPSSRPHTSSSFIRSFIASCAATWWRTSHSWLANRDRR